MRDIREIQKSTNQSFTDVMMQIIRTGLKHSDQLHKNKASIPEIQAQQALWDNELSRMASIYGVNKGGNEPHSDAATMEFLNNVFRELSQSDTEAITGAD